MHPSPRTQISWLLLVSILAGCAGYRGGWHSVAYTGDTPPAPAADAGAAARDRPTLRAPGPEFQVGIDNDLRTYDTQLYVFALPLSIGPRRVYPKNNEPGKTPVFVTVTPSDPGFVFRPAQARLGIGDRQIAGLAGYEFGMWDREGKRVREGGTWDHRAVGREFILAETGRHYYLPIDFATPVPWPESGEITLDLSQAIASPQHPRVPLIRFAPMRWKEGYT